MRKLVPGTFLLGLGLLAGCTAHDAGKVDAKATLAMTAAAQLQANPLSGARPGLPGYGTASRSVLTSFASQPDRGDLVDYGQGKPVQRGAFTAYPVKLSEAHALNAAVPGGTMTITAPDGRPIKLTFDHVEEYPNGNWTWFGRNEKGTLSMLTFGESAAFGTFPDASGDTLKLTMSGGAAYIVVTDPSKVATPGQSFGGQDDQMIAPPMAAQSTIKGKQATPGDVQPQVSATVTPIDIVLGYSPGFITNNKSESQAVTRLYSLAAYTNLVYQNSGISQRVRIVRTVKVNYTDATTNASTLEKLTGYSSTGGSSTPDPAFAELRAARDTYGADLVSMVRPLRQESSGCGIGWLIGANGATFSAASAPFGYSVVSDGTYDVGSGNNRVTYVCAEGTLAHELGHNMGQQHNVEDSAGQAGAHPYSYGYREGANGFYTVMAYPLPNGMQTAAPYFANPAVSYLGRPTGVANQSDNVRSMNLTMPVVATFRQTIVPISDALIQGAIRGAGNKCLDVQGAGTGVGTIVQVWTCNGLRQQQWSIVNGPGANLQNVGTDKVLDVIGFGTTNGSYLQIWNSTGAANQAWYFMKTSIIANGDRVLDAIGTIGADGTRIQIWADLRGANQLWNYNPKNGKITGINGKCLDVVGFGTANGTPVQLWTCTGAENQSWKVGRGGTLIGYGGKCLETANSGTGNGTVVQTSDCTGGANQNWRLKGEIRGFASNLCLDDSGGGNLDGARAQLYGCLGTANQQWEFAPY